MILCNCLCQFSLQLKHSIYQTCIQSWIGALHSLKFVNDYIAISLNDTVYMWNNWKQLHIEPTTYHFVQTLHSSTMCISIEIVFPSLQLSSPKCINSEKCLVVKWKLYRMMKSLQVMPDGLRKKGQYHWELTSFWLWVHHTHGVNVSICWLQIWYHRSLVWRWLWPCFGIVVSGGSKNGYTSISSLTFGMAPMLSSPVSSRVKK